MLESRMHLLIGVAMLGVAVQGATAPAEAINFNQVFVTPNQGAGTIGFAFAGNKFVGTVQRDGLNVMYQTDLTGGNVQAFAPGVSLLGNPSSEHFIASSLGLGGFPSRDLFVASGTTVRHLTNAGADAGVLVNLDAVSGAGTGNFVRGITFDGVGSFGNDMLVTTTTGRVFRVKSDGTASVLASVGEDTEGLDVAPIGTFGPHAGSLLVASEGSGLIRAITPAGVVTILNLGNPVAGAEELSVIPLNLGASGNPVEGFYGADYTPDVIKVPAADFQGLQGDAVVTGEFDHQVSRVHFNTISGLVEITNIGQFPNQPEDGLFVTADIINPPGLVPEPAAILLLSSGVGVMAARRYWRRRA